MQRPAWFPIQIRFHTCHLAYAIDPSPSKLTRGFSFPGTRLFSFHFGAGLSDFSSRKFISSAHRDESVWTEKFTSRSFQRQFLPDSRGGWIIQQLVCRHRWITHTHVCTPLRADFADGFRFVCERAGGRAYTHQFHTSSSSAHADLVFF